MEWLNTLQGAFILNQIPFCLLFSFNFCASTNCEINKHSKVAGLTSRFTALVILYGVATRKAKSASQIFYFCFRSIFVQHKLRKTKNAFYRSEGFFLIGVAGFEYATSCVSPKTGAMTEPLHWILFFSVFGTISSFSILMPPTFPLFAERNDRLQFIRLWRTTPRILFYLSFRNWFYLFNILMPATFPLFAERDDRLQLSAYGGLRPRVLFYFSFRNWFYLSKLCLRPFRFLRNAMIGYGLSAYGGLRNFVYLSVFRNWFYLFNTQSCDRFAFCGTQWYLRFIRLWRTTPDFIFISAFGTLILSFSILMPATFPLFAERDDRLLVYPPMEDYTQFCFISTVFGTVFIFSMSLMPPATFPLFIRLWRTTPRIFVLFQFFGTDFYLFNTSCDLSAPRCPMEDYTPFFSVFGTDFIFQY